MKRSVVVACLVVGLLGGAGFRAAGVALAAGGNSDAAHACQQGGYLTLQGTDGTTFANTGECVSFVARGGAITGVSACTSTSNTGCLTFDNATLTDPGGNTITLSGSTSFVDACQGGDCIFVPPNNLATGGGTYVEKDATGTIIISQGIYRIDNTAGSAEGLFRLFYEDSSGTPDSSCTTATGLRDIGVQATLIDNSGQSQGTIIVGVDTGSLLQVNPSPFNAPFGTASIGADLFFGPVPANTISC